jgi:hypothetical protein
MRWELEKVFDVIENRLQENTSRACTPQSKKLQSLLITIADNLMLLFLARIKAKEAIADEKVEAKRRARLEKRMAAAAERGRQSPCRLRWLESLRRATQNSPQFFRWLRHHLAKWTSYNQAVALLRRLMRCYL